MAYAPDHRPYYDADSHIMELPDFLRDFADPDVRDDIKPVSYKASLVTDEEVALLLKNGGQQPDAHNGDDETSQCQDEGPDGSAKRHVKPVDRPRRK